MKYSESFVIVKHTNHPFYLQNTVHGWRWGEDKNEAELFRDMHAARKALEKLYHGFKLREDGDQRMPTRVSFITLSLKPVEAPPQVFKHEPRMFIPVER